MESINWNNGATRLTKKFSDRFSRLDTIPACVGRTDIHRMARVVFAGGTEGHVLLVTEF